MTDVQRDKHRDPVALAGIGLAILVNLAGIAWLAGKFDQRMTTAERDIADLRLKSSKDGEQDVKIAVISTQLSEISSKLGEVNGKLEARR